MGVGLGGGGGLSSEELFAEVLDTNAQACTKLRMVLSGQTNAQTNAQAQAYQSFDSLMIILAGILANPLAIKMIILSTPPPPVP